MPEKKTTGRELGDVRPSGQVAWRTWRERFLGGVARCEWILVSSCASPGLIPKFEPLGRAERDARFVRVQPRLDVVVFAARVVFDGVRVRWSLTREWRNGRRAGLRIPWGNPWGFESPLPHPLSTRRLEQRVP